MTFFIEIHFGRKEWNEDEKWDETLEALEKLGCCEK